MGVKVRKVKEKKVQRGVKKRKGMRMINPRRLLKNTRRPLKNLRRPLKNPRRPLKNPRKPLKNPRMEVRKKSLVRKMTTPRTTMLLCLCPLHKKREGLDFTYTYDQ